MTEETITKIKFVVYAELEGISKGAVKKEFSLMLDIGSVPEVGNIRAMLEKELGIVLDGIPASYKPLVYRTTIGTDHKGIFRIRVTRSVEDITYRHSLSYKELKKK